MSDGREVTFEAAMAELEDVVRKLESGSVELEKSIELYERGAALKALCEKKLKEAEERVEKITLGASGNPVGTAPAEGL
ncbi:MAG: exodeoxyribonuclease VII small subunit [Proteobacteria bacterium]|nr:exodeoxyribonuclease VII small subunit [Pseudomonadota bacterium]MBS0572045.1 exodeoxyribonuclease VII small subunit [Pseudomonadota bacterium]